MENLLLLQTLRTETESMKNSYIAQISDWSKEEFQRITEARNKIVNDLLSNVIVRNSSTFWKAHKFLDKCYKILHLGVEKFVEKQVKEAIEHYESSILKLSAKIEKKGLNIEKLEVKSGRVGVNFETTLTDGEKIVRAFTIVASGDIQKPHYRYLIK